MTSLRKLPMLIFCEDCSNHGRILLEDGRSSPEFAFQVHGIVVIDQALRSQFVTREEHARLLDELSSSSLPKNYYDVSEPILWQVHQYNLLHGSDSELGIHIHNFLHTDLKPGEIPDDFHDHLVNHMRVI